MYIEKALLLSKIDQGGFIPDNNCDNLFAKKSLDKRGPPIFDESESDSLIVIISRYYSSYGQIKMRRTRVTSLIRELKRKQIFRNTLSLKR